MIRRSSLLFLALAMVLLAACDQDPTPVASTSPEPLVSSEASGSPEAVGPSPTMTAAVQIVAAETDLGEILTDSEGFTLYAFTNDTEGVSTCYDECATNWPPLLADTEDLDSGEGVASNWLGSVERDDGSSQVTYAGWPLYYFAADAEVGDINGQLVGGVWFVVSPDGQLVGGPEVSPDETEEAEAGLDY